MRAPSSFPVPPTFSSSEPRTCSAGSPGPARTRATHGRQGRGVSAGPSKFRALCTACSPSPAGQQHPHTQPQVAPRRTRTHRFLALHRVRVLPVRAGLLFKLPNQAGHRDRTSAGVSQTRHNRGAHAQDAGRGGRRTACTPSSCSPGPSATATPVPGPSPGPRCACPTWVVTGTRHTAREGTRHHRVVR